MNALELADYVDFLYSELSYGYEVTGENLDEVADMLRQQQAEIEALKYWQDTWRPFLKQHLGVESCNGFCGEQECKENQANCKRINK
jgi:hypothetical protein